MFRQTALFASMALVSAMFAFGGISEASAGFAGVLAVVLALLGLAALVFASIEQRCSDASEQLRVDARHRAGSPGALELVAARQNQGGCPTRTVQDTSPGPRS
jgi:uncharacterized membrane protein YtjA (UPF0391 family)